MATNISTLGQQISLIQRNKEISAQMSTYQQQVTTGVKHTTFKEYGAEALSIQRYRSSLGDIQNYIYNIDTTQVNIQQMNSSMQENMDQAGNILSAISVQMAKGSDFDLDSIKSAAKTALQIVEANMNTKIGNRYLFAGSDVTQKPYNNASAGENSIQAQISNWLDGTQTSDQLLTSLNGLTDSQTGYSSSLQSAKGVYARADDGFEVDYTVLANSEGFKKIVNGLRTIANMEFPTEGTDVPTKDDFYNVLNAVYATVQSGVEGMRTDTARIASAAQALDTVKQNHLDDQSSLQQQLEHTEAADTSEAVVKFQTLQTQLQASYQVTSILSQLSLARFLGG